MKLSLYISLVESDETRGYGHFTDYYISHFAFAVPAFCRCIAHPDPRGLATHRVCPAMVSCSNTEPPDAGKRNVKR